MLISLNERLVNWSRKSCKSRADGLDVDLVLVDLPEVHEGFKDAVEIGLGHAIDEVGQIRDGRLVDATGHATVDEAQPSIGEQKQIARVRVGVEEADLQHLPQHGEGARSHEVLALLVAQIRLAPVREQNALDLFEAEHAFASGLPIDQREPRLFALFDVGAKEIGVATFVFEIEFETDRSRELLDNRFGVERKIRRVPGDPLGDGLQNVDVGVDSSIDAGSQNLEYDGLVALSQHGAMCLSHGGSGHGFLIDREEQFVQVAEVFLKLGLDLRPRDRGHIGLEFLELRDVVRRQQVGAGAENLTEFDEGRPECFQRESKPHWPAHGLNGGVRRAPKQSMALFEQEVELGILKELPEAELHQDRKDLPIPIRVSHQLQHGHGGDGTGGLSVSERQKANVERRSGRRGR